MKGFSGDDIMEGQGSFTKFIGGLGYDWGSYELATQGVQEDMNRKEFVAANGAVDNVRDVWQETEGASVRPSTTSCWAPTTPGWSSAGTSWTTST